MKNSFFLVTKPLRCRVVAHPARATDSERSHKGERGHGGVRGGAPSWRTDGRRAAPSVVAAMTTATKPGIFPDGMGGIHAFPWDLERGHTLAAGTWDSERHTRLVRMVRAGIGLIAGFLFSRQGAETPAARILDLLQLEWW